MARVKVSEYAAKKLLLGEKYTGVSVSSGAELSAIDLTKGMYVVKVDDGTKKRNKLGLVTLGLTAESAAQQAQQFLGKGRKRVLIELQSQHDIKDEQYLSCGLVREGVEVLYAKQGGNAVEEGKGIIRELISRKDFFAGKKLELATVPKEPLQLLLNAMRQYHISFIESNPFLYKNEKVQLLDLAVEIDSSRLHLLPEWVGAHIQKQESGHESEVTVQKLAEQSIASFAHTVLNPNGSVFVLLSGGGASLVALDSLVSAGLEDQVGNYGEYSGAPNREETKLYTEAILSLMFASSAPKKVLVIAGGVANFTDVTTTFKGIIDSCREQLDQFRKQNILVRVRRGGPRQAEGLALLQAFFDEHNISAIVSDPSVSLPKVGEEVAAFLTS